MVTDGGQRQVGTPGFPAPIIRAFGGASFASPALEGSWHFDSLAFLTARTWGAGNPDVPIRRRAGERVQLQIRFGKTGEAP